MKVLMKEVVTEKGNYQVLYFVCPGCKEFGGSGLHTLAVNTSIVQPAWAWSKNLERPTLSPSILTHSEGKVGEDRCHSYLWNGVFEYLPDCTHSLAGLKIEMPDLPDWVIKE